MTLLAVSNTGPGMHLGEDLFLGSRRGAPHFRRGQEITPDMRRRLERAGLLVVDVALDWTGEDDGVREVVIRPEGEGLPLEQQRVPVASLTPGALAGRGVRRRDGSCLRSFGFDRRRLLYRRLLSTGFGNNFNFGRGRNYGNGLKRGLNFDGNLRGFRLDRNNLGNHFDTARTAPDHISMNPSLHDFLVRLDLPQTLILRRYHAIGYDFLFTYMDLRLCRRRQGGADAGRLVIFERTLGLFPFDSHLLQMSDEILRFDSEILG